MAAGKKAVRQWDRPRGAGQHIQLCFPQTSALRSVAIRPTAAPHRPQDDQVVHLGLELVVRSSRIPQGWETVMVTLGLSWWVVIRGQELTEGRT